ncbi:MAG: sensor histidine kinase [Cyclobacteriaceae bacterium]
MRIQQKLTLWFSVAAVCLLVLFGFSIYFFSAKYRQNEFYTRLLDRVEISEKMLLEKESMSPEQYERIRQQFLQTLPGETEEALTLDQVKELRDQYPGDFIDNLIQNEQAFFSYENRQGVGKIFHLPAGEYAVILTAVDQVGIKKLDYLLSIVMLALIVAIAVIATVSYYLSVAILKPISEKIKKANQISANNLHERLVVYDPDDEMGELAVAFNKLLERIDGAFEAQKLFISNASHELRNPLAAIVGEAELTLDKPRSVEEYQRALQVIAAEAGHMELLVHNLLQLSKLSYLGDDIKFESVDLQELLISVKKKVDYAEPNNRVKLHLSEFKSGTACMVKGNWNLLMTAFYNCVENACKFSDAGDVLVSLDPADSNRLLITVTDHGIGIPPEDLPKVTSPFFRSQNAVTRKGSGIGIPLTQRIIALHKGKLQVESQLNKGTKVSIWLNIERSPQ